MAECYCSECIDRDYVRSRQKLNATYRDLRRDGRRAEALELYRRVRQAKRMLVDSITENLFYTDHPNPIGGLQALLPWMRHHA